MNSTFPNLSNLSCTDIHYSSIMNENNKVYVFCEQNERIVDRMFGLDKYQLNNLQISCPYTEKVTCEKCKEIIKILFPTSK